MRALLLLLIFSSSMLALRANESTEVSEVSEVSEAEPAAAPPGSVVPSPARPAPVNVSRPDDSFLPTDQLRYDQEVDYPTDI